MGQETGARAERVRRQATPAAKGKKRTATPTAGNPMLLLQRSAGNAAVAALLAKRQREDDQDEAPVARAVQEKDEEETEEVESAEGETEEKAEKAEELVAEKADPEEEAGESETEQGEVVGTIHSEEGPEESTAAPGGEYADASVERAGSRSSTASTERGSMGGTKVVVGSVGARSSIRQGAFQADGAQDEIVARPTSNVNALGAGRAIAKPFGSMNRQLSYDYAYKFKWNKKAKENYLVIDLGLNLQTHYGVKSPNGYLDITSGSDPAITAENYQNIVTDLTPVLNEKSWVPPRTMSWAQALTLRHEKFHANDIAKWVKGAGKKFAADYWANKTIDSDGIVGDEPNLHDIIHAKIDAARVDAESAIDQAAQEYMRGVGLTYYSYPTEERAFGDGKSAYLNLAKGVEKTGKSLVKKRDKEAKKAEKAAKKTAGTTTAPTTPPTTPPTT